MIGLITSNNQVIKITIEPRKRLKSGDIVEYSYNGIRRGNITRNKHILKLKRNDLKACYNRRIKRFEIIEK